MTDDTEKRAGRPRKHRDAQARVASWRHKQEGRRLDLYISNQASWRLKRLSAAWNCSMAAVVERLTLEADAAYSDILFPETE